MAKILLGASEDDLYIAYAPLVDSLRDAGYDISETNEADDVIKAMIKRSVDFVIVQGPMRWGSLGKERTCVGRVSGYVAVQKARERGSTIPTIFLETAWRPPPVENVMVRRMPILPSELLEAVREMLG